MGQPALLMSALSDSSDSSASLERRMYSCRRVERVAACMRSPCEAKFWMLHVRNCAMACTFSVTISSRSAAEECMAHGWVVPRAGEVNPPHE